jgi:hypothetical protein
MRLFDHYSDKDNVLHYYNVLLLVSIVMCIAVDTSICERGFSTMNNLKTARRSRMGAMLLRTLMVICELGKEWQDPNKIPVEEIVEEWRTQSSRGRYESAMWTAAGLEESVVSKGTGGKEWGEAELEGGEQVDNLEAGGFFAHYGREPAARPRARTRILHMDDEHGEPAGP